MFVHDKALKLYESLSLRIKKKRCIKESVSSKDLG